MLKYFMHFHHSIKIPAEISPKIRQNILKIRKKKVVAYVLFNENRWIHSRDRNLYEFYDFFLILKISKENHYKIFE